jgi:hypothetical protein
MVQMTDYMSSSIDALKHLLMSGQELGNENCIHYSCFCHISKIPENISYMRNGIKYYSVQVTCDNGIQYGIQAYGDEAENLYKELYKYAEHGKAASEKEY